MQQRKISQQDCRQQQLQDLCRAADTSSSPAAVSLFDQLPDELLAHVLAALRGHGARVGALERSSGAVLSNAALVCRKWHRLALGLVDSIDAAAKAL